MNRQRFLLNSFAMLLAGPAIVRGASSEFIYVVKKGDTLGQIARRQGVTLKQLKSYNGLTKDLIVVGQKLKIPS